MLPTFTPSTCRKFQANRDGTIAVTLTDHDLKIIREKSDPKNPDNWRVVNKKGDWCQGKGPTPEGLDRATIMGIKGELAVGSLLNRDPDLTRNERPNLYDFLVETDEKKMVKVEVKTSEYDMLLIRAAEKVAYDAPYDFTYRSNHYKYNTERQGLLSDFYMLVKATDDITDNQVTIRGYCSRDSILDRYPSVTYLDPPWTNRKGARTKISWINYEFPAVNLRRFSIHM